MPQKRKSENLQPKKRQHHASANDTGVSSSLKRNVENGREPSTQDRQEDNLGVVILFSKLCFERLFSLAYSYLVHDFQHVLRHVRQPDGQDGYRLREIDVAHLTAALQKHVAGSSMWATRSGPSGRASPCCKSRVSSNAVPVYFYLMYADRSGGTSTLKPKIVTVNIMGSLQPSCYLPGTPNVSSHQTSHIHGRTYTYPGQFQAACAPPPIQADPRTP